MAKRFNNTLYYCERIERSISQIKRKTMCEQTHIV